MNFKFNLKYILHRNLFPDPDYISDVFIDSAAA